jgi:3-oxoacyl-[acyl-carrier protein] reductase
MHIILGGTSGLGREMAQQLRAQGRRVLVLGKTHNPEEHGEGFALDVYYPEQVQAACNRMEQLLNGDDIEQFVWSTGYGWRGNFEDQSDARAMAEVNFAGALPMVQRAWRKMIQQDRKSSLVVIGSTSSVKARSDEAVYVATKHAQAGLARSLGMQADEQNLPVKVALFLPGAMKTPFWNGRERPNDYMFFNDPAKVAEHILNATQHQQQPFLEWALPKGTLL